MVSLISRYPGRNSCASKRCHTAQEQRMPRRRARKARSFASDLNLDVVVRSAVLRRPRRERRCSVRPASRFRRAYESRQGGNTCCLFVRYLYKMPAEPGHDRARPDHRVRVASVPCKTRSQMSRAMPDSSAPAHCPWQGDWLAQSVRVAPARSAGQRPALSCRWPRKNRPG